MPKKTRKGIRKFDGKTYVYSGKFSKTKDALNRRLANARKKGYAVRAVPMKTVGPAKRKLYPIFVRANKTKSGYYKPVKKK